MGYPEYLPTSCKTITITDRSGEKRQIEVENAEAITIMDCNGAVVPPAVAVQSKTPEPNLPNH